jgi:hypothetical protein
MSTYTPTQYLEKYAPPLYALGDGVYSFWLDDAANGMNPDQSRLGWGSTDRYNKAQALIAAHNWTRSGSAATVDLGDGQLAARSPGAIASQTTIRESVAYGNPGVNNVNMGVVEAEWATTVYGRMLIQIIKTRAAFKFMVIGAPGPLSSAAR